MTKYLFLLLVSVISIWWSIFAWWFWYTNLTFFDWVTTQKTLNMNIVVGTWSTGFWVDIFNPTEQNQSLKLDFVAQVQTPDGRDSCDMISGKEFWNNFVWDLWNFSVDAGLVERKRIDFNFPICASWLFLGCAVQLAPTETSVWSFDVVPGKVNFMTLQVSPSSLCTPFNIKVFPGSRPWANFSNIGEIRFYNSSNVLQYSWMITTSQFWTWILSDTMPSGIYSVVYKWQSQLASYLSGVEVIEWWELSLDFTTWSNLYNTQNKSITENDGSQYQIAWDLKNVLGQYDFMINGNDIAILTVSWFIDTGIPILDSKNLNGDAAINVSDISIVGINFERTDPFLSSIKFNW